MTERPGGCGCEVGREGEGGVAVCVVSWNSGAWIGRCLESLRSQTLAPAEILVVDNASHDRTLEEVRSFDGKIRLVANSRNVGFSRAVNQAHRSTRHPFLATVNPDVVLQPDYLEICVRGLMGDPSAGAATGLLLRSKSGGGEDGDAIDSAGLCLGRDRRGGDRGQGRRPGPGFDEAGYVFGSCAAAAVYRRAMLEDLAYPGGEVFDESFFCYKEDLDLGWRGRLFGWNCLFLPEARARHHRGWRREGRESIPEAIRIHSLKNRYLMLLKNETASGFLRNLGPMLWFELRALVYLLLFEPGLWKVYPAVLRHAPDAWRKRRWIQGRSGRNPLGGPYMVARKKGGFSREEGAPYGRYGLRGARTARAGGLGGPHRGLAGEKELTAWRPQ